MAISRRSVCARFVDSSHHSSKHAAWSAARQYVEVGDHFAVVLVVFHVRQNRLFRFPVPPARSAAEVTSVVLSTKDEYPSVSAFTEAFSRSVIMATTFLSVVVAALFAEGQYAEGRGG